MLWHLYRATARLSVCCCSHLISVNRVRGLRQSSLRVWAALENESSLRRAADQDVIQTVRRCPCNKRELVLPHRRPTSIPYCCERHAHIQLQAQGWRAQKIEEGSGQLRKLAQ
jgi:hypothetical protein